MGAVCVWAKNTVQSFFFEANIRLQHESELAKSSGSSSKLAVFLFFLVSEIETQGILLPERLATLDDSHFFQPDLTTPYAHIGMIWIIVQN